MHICVISEDYPYKDFSSFEFVKQLCVAWADQGVTVSVIAPQSITKSAVRRLSVRPKVRTETTENKNEIKVYSPYIVTMGNLGCRGILNNMLSRIRQKAIASIIRGMKDKPDVIYGHFWHSAYDAYNVAKKENIPLFVASGECDIELHKRFNLATLQNFISYVSGVICVSTKNKKESIEAGLATEDKCIVIPNAINGSLFYKKDKCQLRRSFGFSENDFIVAFVGGFIPRKGPKRVAEAIVSLHDSQIKSIFIGRLLSADQSQNPECPGILFRGQVSHRKISDYLNCADVFVMPTLREGCCNANIEAMACGLPVISSNMEFNYDILDESCSILIDPMNIEEIARSISYLKSNPDRCQELSNNALKKAESLRIDIRAQRIIEYIVKNCNI